MAIYVLIDSSNDIVDKIDSITPGGAEHYFMERKKIYDKNVETAQASHSQAHEGCANFN